MTHSAFTSKMESLKPIHEAWVSGGRKNKWKELAEKFSLTPIQASSKVRYYENHISDPICPMLGECSHSSVVNYARYLPVGDIDKLRAALISTLSSNLEFNKVRQSKITPKILRIVLPISELEWFEKRGQPLVHWKHEN